MWKLDIQGDVNGFLDADVYHYAVDKNGDKFEYFKMPQIPKTKVTVLSATLQEAMYRCFFRDRQIMMYDIPKVRYQGKLIQYAYYSMSRNDIEKHCKELKMSCTDLYRYIMDFCSDFDYGITFMTNEKCMGQEVLHFGNAVGVDKYKGKNGLIIGTQHLDENSYKLAAFCLGIDVEYKLERHRVTFGGYEFPMMKYENTVLRMIQLYMISSEMEQCIGRSRLLRTDAVVYLFSNFPCEQAELRFDDYLKEKDASVPSQVHQQ